MSADLSVLDWVIAALLVLGAVRGALIGLSRQIFSFVMLGAAVWAAARFQPALAQRIAGSEAPPDALARALAYVLLFAGVCAGALLIRLVARLLFRFSFSPLLERIGGAALGLLTTALGAIAALVLLTMIPHEGLHRVVAEESWAGRQVTGLFPRLYRELAEKYPLPEWAQQLSDEAAPLPPAGTTATAAPTNAPAPVER
ncbi:MAG: CvpA family protein [Kiritimatiellae bacterium]|nr:CvpA family protein [Kiritimatiellia bacterium]